MGATTPAPSLADSERETSKRPEKDVTEVTDRRAVLHLKLEHLIPNRKDLGNVQRPRTRRPHVHTRVRERAEPAFVRARNGEPRDGVLALVQVISIPLVAEIQGVPIIRILFVAESRNLLKSDGTINVPCLVQRTIGFKPNDSHFVLLCYEDEILDYLPSKATPADGWCNPHSLQFGDAGLVLELEAGTPNCFASEVSDNKHPVWLSQLVRVSRGALRWIKTARETLSKLYFECSKALLRGFRSWIGDGKTES
jgi:hypothetical protein